MPLHRAAVVHTSIGVPAAHLIAFMGDLEKWKRWAPWIRSVSRSSARDWAVETDVGPLRFHFVESNPFGVLDHEVTLPSGAVVTNGMRVMTNGTGSELVMVLFQLPETPADEFERDVQAVTADLARIRQVLEATR